MDFRRSFLLSTAGILLATTTPPALAAGGTERVSVGAKAKQADGFSSSPDLSGKGARVVFDSQATNFVVGDSNGSSDIFLRDRDARTTARVSLSSTGIQADSDSFGPVLSRDGRYAAFSSGATNLVPGDGNGSADGFLRDLKAGTTKRVSLSSRGKEVKTGPVFVAGISPEGGYVVLTSRAADLASGTAPGVPNVFVRDVKAGKTTLESRGLGGKPADGFSFAALGHVLSKGGRFLVFHSEASNLVPSDGNGAFDVFVRDRKKGTSVLVSLAAGGGPADGESTSGVISDDGRFVAFQSAATNLVAGDANGVSDVFVRDLKTGATTRVSQAQGGGESDGASFAASISADGRYVGFTSRATNLVTGDANGSDDSFVVDRTSGKTSRVSVGTSGNEVEHPGSPNGVIAANGSAFAFVSEAAGLVPKDTNNAQDVFVRDLGR